MVYKTGQGSLYSLFFGKSIWQRLILKSKILTNLQTVLKNIESVSILYYNLIKIYKEVIKMLTDELIELVDLIQKQKAEAQTVEVKAAHDGCPKRLYDTLSSFSNQDNGGILVFGLDERAGFQAVGVYDLQDLQRRVSEQCNQMEPPVRAVFTFVEYKGVNICSAEIPAIDITERPCYYKGIGKVKGSYIRVGDADLPMTDYEIYSYEAYRKHLHDDERPIDRTTIEILDKINLEVYVNEKKKEKPGFALMDNNQIYEMLSITRGEVPTLAAIMNFCFYPQGIFPQFGITAIVVPGYEIGDLGEDKERFIDNKRINGRIADMVDEALTFCKRNMKVKTIIDADTGKRRDKTEYPIDAVREAVLNALIHRDYSIHTEGTPVQIDFFTDRLEIHSPGNLYGRMTVEQLGVVKPDLRNPTLAIMAESMTEAESRYSGIPTIRRDMREYGLPDPVFENRRNEFVVTLYNGENVQIEVKKDDNITGKKSMQELLIFCQNPRSRDDIAAFLGIKTKFYIMEKYINPLIEHGDLKMTLPEKPQSKLQRYYTAEA